MPNLRETMEQLGQGSSASGVSKEEFHLNQQVVVKADRLHGNLSELKTGEIVAVRGDKVSVAFHDEMKPKEFAKDQVTPASAVFGIGANINNPRELPIKKMLR